MGGLFSRSKKSAPVTVAPPVPEIPNVAPNSTFDVLPARSPTYGQCAILLVIPKNQPAGAGIDYVAPRSPPASIPPRPTLSQRNLNSPVPKPPPLMRPPVQTHTSDAPLGIPPASIPPRPTLSQRNLNSPSVQHSPQSPRQRPQQPQQPASPSMGQSHGNIPVPPRPTLSQRSLQQQQLQHKPTYTVTQQHSAYSAQSHQSVDTSGRFNSVPRRNPQQQLRPKIDVPPKPQPRSPPTQTRNGFNGIQTHTGGYTSNNHNNNNRQNGFNGAQTHNNYNTSYNTHNNNNYHDSTTGYTEESYNSGGGYTEESYSNNNNYDTSTNYTDNSYNNYNEQYTQENSGWGEQQTQDSGYSEDTSSTAQHGGWGQEEQAAPAHQVRATYDYYPQSDRELTFKKGDLITVVNTHASGWWDGELNGVYGKFPNNHVEELY